MFSGDEIMASLEMNKIAAGVLCAGLVAMAAGKIADVLVDPKPLEKNAYVVMLMTLAPQRLQQRLRVPRMSLF